MILHTDRYVFARQTVDGREGGGHVKHGDLGFGLLRGFVMSTVLRISLGADRGLLVRSLEAVLLGVSGGYVSRFHRRQIPALTEEEHPRGHTRGHNYARRQGDPAALGDPRPKACLGGRLGAG